MNIKKCNLYVIINWQILNQIVSNTKYYFIISHVYF